MKRETTAGTELGDKYPGIVDSRGVLSDCCKLKAPALIISTARATLTHARFEEILQDSVALSLNDNTTLEPLSLCCVSFSFDNRAHIFLANVQNCQHRGESVFIQLDLPSHVTIAELRSSYRVPVTSNSNLQVAIRRNGRKSLPQVVDISMTGICVKFSDAAELPSVNEWIDIELRTAGHELNLKGHVRYTSKQSCGIIFPEATRNNRIETPETETLRSLVRKLEMDYLRHRNACLDLSSV